LHQDFIPATAEKYSGNQQNHWKNIWKSLRVLVPPKTNQTSDRGDPGVFLRRLERLQKAAWVSGNPPTFEKKKRMALKKV